MEKYLIINRNGQPRRIAGHLADERGIVLIAALLVMIFLTFIGTTVVILSSSNIKVSRNNESSSQAFMIAEAGVAEAIDKLRTNTNWGPDLNGDGTVDMAEDSQWNSVESLGDIVLSDQTGKYNITLYDRTGSNGRLPNMNRPDNYATLTTNDVLVEVSGEVGGFKREVSVIVRSAVEAFEYALFSEGAIDANGTGPDPGTINGKQYAKAGINWQGNYDLTQSEAVTTANSVSPNCPSGKWKQCDVNATAIDAPLLDFAYYQDQANFGTQQVFVMTPTVGGAGNTADCTGTYRNGVDVGCDRTWMIRYTMETLGSTYTLTARVEARDEAPPVANNKGNDWDHEVFYCATPNPVSPWNGTDANCPGGGTPVSFSFNSDDVENDKPFVNAPQFNEYTDPTAPYTSSIVNVFDAQGHLEFLGPSAGVTTTVTASILVGTAADNSTPIGKIDIEGGEGGLIFAPANGLAIVAEKIAFKAKYSNINVTVGSPMNGALLIARRELEIEGEYGNKVTMTLNGSAVVGGDNLDGAADNDDDAGIEIEHSTDFNVNYVPLNNYPAGWSDYGSLVFERREWREL